MERAEKVEAELGTNYPSFVKPMRVTFNWQLDSEFSDNIDL